MGEKTVILETREFLDSVGLDSIRAWVEVDSYVGDDKVEAWRSLDAGFIITEEQVGHFCSSVVCVDTPAELNSVLAHAKGIVRVLGAFIKAVESLPAEVE
jgi:hypothetical protein